MIPIGAARAGVVSGGDVVPDSGIFRLEFEDDSDTATAIDSWNNNDATITGPTYDSLSKYGIFSLLCDGANDYITLPETVFTEDSPHSYFIWANLDSATGATFLRSDKNNTAPRGIGLYTDSSGILTFFDGNSPSATHSGTIPTGSYEMFGYTTNGTDTVTLYIGDTGETKTINMSTDSGNNFDIGYQPTRGQSPLDGNIDDPRGYNKELTSTEVSNLYTTGSI